MAVATIGKALAQSAGLKGGAQMVNRAVERKAAAGTPDASCAGQRLRTKLFQQLGEVPRGMDHSQDPHGITVRIVN